MSLSDPRRGDSVPALRSDTTHSLLRHQLDLNVAAYGLCITPQRRERWRMLPGRFQARDSTFRSSHPLSYCVLSEPSASACLQQLIGDLVLEIKSVIGFAESFAKPCFRQERFMIMPDRVVLQLSHLCNSFARLRAIFSSRSGVLAGQASISARTRLWKYSISNAMPGG